MALSLARSSGVQLHPTSLPGGRLGDDAYRFADWLAEAGQSWWQMLPLGPPDRERSPYKSRSAFAAWPGLLADPAAPVDDDEIVDFREREAFWIGDWERFAGGRRAVADQVRFAREWGALRAYCAQRGVRLIGDVPIYVAPGSADQEAHPELFRGGEVAGVPPDAFSDSGQLWGNPLYDWPALRRRRYRWWTERLRRTFALFDVTRIDHFRGFVAYWAVPQGARDARSGRWRRGPGRAVFAAAEKELGTLPVIAEDLGVITEPVTRLRRELGFPGMVVLQFAFDPDDPAGPHRLDHHEPNSVAYSGTHDHDTLRGWWESAPAAVRRTAEEQVDRAGLREREPWWSLIRLTFSSPARLAMLQAQDVLGLGSEARMNVPGRPSGSWRWRLQPGQLTDALGRRLRAATEEAGRLHAP
ncbi:MAG: 4-alpha-glucanotransferase [Actinomycetota bacterium]|nr:4-alpha-glucanotransferase [Actinomycetota bacterium]